MYQKTKLFNFIRYSGLYLLLLFTGFPILFLFLSTFKESKEIFAFPPSFIFKFTIENFYTLASEWPQFYSSLLNSAIIVLGSGLLTILVAAPAGYALSRYKDPFFKGSAFFLLAIRMYPPIVLTIPLFPVISQIGLIDTYWILILLYSTFFISLSTWLMKTFMDEVPVEIEEAAKIEGANTFQLITKIVIPLSLQGIVATSIFVSIFAWKEYMIAYIFTGIKVRPAPVLLAQMLDPVIEFSWGSLFAAASIQLLPVLIFLLLIQNLLVKGITTGGVKG